VTKINDRVRLIGGLALLIALVAFDAWQVAHRCEFSPPVDWSRLAFGVMLQVMVLAAWFSSGRWMPQLPPNLHFVTAVLLIAFAFGSCTTVAGAVRFGDVHGSWQWRSQSTGQNCQGPT
jgi:hypothetical protein